MTQKDAEFLKRLLAMFRLEAAERLQVLASGLVQLEQTGPPEEQAELVETLFREIHSLKGAARSVNLPDIEAVCRPLESVLAALKQQHIALAPPLFDLLHQAVDLISSLTQQTEAPGSTATRPEIKTLVRQLEDAVEGRLADGEAGPTEDMATADVTAPGNEGIDAPVRSTIRPSGVEKGPLTETVRIATEKLDTLLLQAEELIAAKMAARRQVAELTETREYLSKWKRTWAQIHPHIQSAQHAHNTNDRLRNGTMSNDQMPVSSPVNFTPIFEFLTWNARYVTSLEEQMDRLIHMAKQDQRTLSRMVDVLLDDMKQTVMLPVDSLLAMFPKVVRDLARDQNKEVTLVTEGNEIEIDRRILEEMRDSLVHLVRNSVDHGIEPPDERVRNGKRRQGTITIAFTARQGNQVELRVADDGRGIDLENLTAAAARAGVEPAAGKESPEPEELYTLAFRSGVSTSTMVTDISGRGLGLAIVRDQVQKLGGAISLASEPGQGTTFHIRLPLTQTTFRGVIATVSGQSFVIPTMNVERVLRLRPEEIETVESQDVIYLDGQAVAVRGLDELVHFPPTETTGTMLKFIVLSASGQRIALRVDDVTREQEVLVKSIGRELSGLHHIAGATLLSAGQVALILNPAELIQLAADESRLSPIARTNGEETSGFRREAGETAAQKILVVEDSITSRTLIKNILEATGYEVVTAVDGVDALTQLRSEPFDLVVSDVEMPRLDGLGLTEEIRQDERLRALPVILVTARDSREDRERGIDAGANAYLVKSSFDQSDLVEMVRRFI